MTETFAVPDDAELHLAALSDLMVGFNACLQQKAVLPSLILLYSGIDTAGWIASDKTWATQSSFEEWVKRYVLPHCTGRLTASDLFAARCGALHTMSTTSKMSKNGHASEITYLDGEEPAAAVAEFDRLLAKVRSVDPDLPGNIPIHYSELCRAFLLGMRTFIEDLLRDPDQFPMAKSKLSQTIGGFPVSRLHAVEVEAEISSLRARVREAREDR